MPLTAARIEAFLEMMSAERGASENTLMSYRRDLEDAAVAVSGPAGLAGASPAEIRAFIDGLAARGFAATTQARKLSALRQFFRFLYAEGLRGDDPTGTVESPKKQRPLPKVPARPMSACCSTAPRPKSPIRQAATASPRQGCTPCRRCCMPPGFASRNWSACRFPWRAGTSVISPWPARAARSASCRCRPRRAPRCVPGSPSAPAARGTPTARSCSRLPPTPVICRARCSRANSRRWPRAPGSAHRGFPARAAPRFRQPSAAERGRPTRRAAASRPCRHLDHADLHACARKAIGRAGQPAPSACRLGPRSLFEASV